MVLADRLGIDVFGIGEHHGAGFADSSPPVLLAAAAALTTRIRLTSAITILGIADPVRLFEEFATLDLVSNGRAEIVAGRGAYAEAFALFGHDLSYYDELFAEKLDLLLRLQTGEPVHWQGRHRPPLNGEIVFLRPIQRELPVWIGATGTPSSWLHTIELLAREVRARIGKGPIMNAAPESRTEEILVIDARRRRL